MKRSIFSTILAGFSSMFGFAQPRWLDRHMRLPSGSPLPGKKSSNAATRRSATKRRNVAKRLSLKRR